jgi:hypothetical protein
VEMRRAACAARVDKMPPRWRTSLVPLQRVCRQPTLRKARGEAIPARRRGFRVPPVLWISLCEPIRKPAVSRYQPSAEAQDAPRRRAEHPRPLCGEAAEDALADLLSVASQGDGGAGVLAHAGDRRYPPALSGSLERGERRRRLISATAGWQQGGWHVARQIPRAEGRSQPRMVAAGRPLTTLGHPLGLSFPSRSVTR